MTMSDLTKAQWIMLQPLDEGPTSVAARGVEQGYEDLTANQVSGARAYYASKKGKTKKSLGRPRGTTKAARPAKSRPAEPDVPPPRTETEWSLVTMAGELGIQRAAELLTYAQGAISEALRPR